MHTAHNVHQQYSVHKTNPKQQLSAVAQCQQQNCGRLTLYTDDVDRHTSFLLAQLHI